MLDSQIVKKINLNCVYMVWKYILLSTFKIEALRVGGTEISSQKSKLINQVKHFDFINWIFIYISQLLNNAELITWDDLTIEKHPG